MKQPDCNQYRVETLYQNSRLGGFGVVILISVTLYITDVGLSRSLLYCLVLAALGVTLYVINMTAHQRAVTQPGYQPNHWANSMTIISALNGLVLSAILCHSLDLNQHSHVYLVSTILVMSMFGSSIIAATCRRVHAAWTLSSLLPLSLWLSFETETELSILGLMLLFSGIPISFLLNHYYSQMNERSFRLRMDNLDLIAQVSAEKERAERANQVKSDFLTATSHDLRQPLYALNLFIGALANTQTTPEQSLLITKAQQSGHSLAELLNALLEIAQLDSGILKVHRQRFDLQPLLSDIAAEFTPQLHSKNIALRLRLRPRIVDSDRLLLSRIIRNLMTNAIKHSQATKILLAIRTTPGQTYIEFYDNGIGISGAVQKKIFSEFYQLNNPARDHDKGQGLGLAIVQRLSRLLAHPITLKSEEGRGSHFRLILTTPPDEKTDESDQAIGPDISAVAESKQATTAQSPVLPSSVKSIGARTI